MPDAAPCTEFLCRNRARERGLCGVHLAAALRRGRFEEYFWERVDKSGDCWVWTRATDDNGYGSVSRDGRSEGAHRVSWELANGPIPDDLWVLHRCDNPPCVRPEHLFLGTAANNWQDMMNKGRGQRPSEPLSALV